MAKLSKDQLWTRELDVLHYKWEFLRRNKEFRTEYTPVDKQIKQLKISRSAASEINKDQESIIQELINKVYGSMEQFIDFFSTYLKLTEKWEMPGFIPPKMTFKNFVSAMIDPKHFHNQTDEILSYSSFFAISMTIGYKNSYLGKSDIFPVILELTRAGREDQTDRKDIIHLGINLNYPKSVIMHFVEFYIDTYSKTYSDKIDDETRARFEKYDEYLQIYDCKVETGWDLADVAIEVYSEKDIKQKISGTTLYELTCRNYKKCKELINSGYKKIR